MSDTSEFPRLRELRPDPRGNRLAAKIRDCGHSGPERYEVFAIPTRVADIAKEVRTTTTHRDERGEFGVQYHPIGWFVLFEGSRERLFVGHEKPRDLNVGDVVWISIQKEIKP